MLGCFCVSLNNVCQTQIAIFNLTLQCVRDLFALYVHTATNRGSWFIVSSSVFVQLISLSLNQASDVVE